MSYIKENIRNPKVGNISPTGDLSPTRKIFTERPSRKACCVKITLHPFISYNTVKNVIVSIVIAPMLYSVLV